MIFKIYSKLFLLLIILLFLVLPTKSISCRSNCKTCNSTSCTQCSTGYFLSQTNCYPCMNHCNQCQFTNNTILCSTCSADYVKSNDKLSCYQCMEMCNGCSNLAYNCTRCYDGDILIQNIDGTRSCGTNNVCSKNCGKCNTTKDCLICVAGTYLFNNSCIRCSYPCNQCKFNSSTLIVDCNQCVNAYYLSGTNCIKCQSNCIQCNSTICFKCAKGFKTSANSCLSCPPTCQECTSSGCTSCITSYSLVSGLCIFCSDQCSSCNSNDTSTCLTCGTPYTSSPRSTTGQCFRCKQQSCKICQTQNLCQQCYPLRLLLKGICYECPYRCQVCIFVNTTKVCLKCLQRSVLMNGVCVYCDKGCLECSPSNKSICLTCQVGTFNNRGSCTQCPMGCKKCVSELLCTDLQAGFTIINQNFTQCIIGCKTCIDNNPQKCLECIDKYYLNGYLCLKCDGINCLRCQSNKTNECSACQPQDNLVNGGCQQCSSKCLICNSSNINICKSCVTYYTLSGTGCSKDCGTYCLRCDTNSNNVCLQCQYGYGITSDGDCIRCFGSCTKTCMGSDPSICLQCPVGFELINNTCIPCSSGCNQCYNGVCANCQDQYFRNEVNGNVFCSIRCTFPCKNCIGSLCTQCYYGYDFTDGSCKLNLNQTLSYCPTGSYFNQSAKSCAICAANCANCNITVCFNCIKGYFLKESQNKCQKCDTDCTDCQDAVTCKLCKPQYYRRLLQTDVTTQIKRYSSFCKKCSLPCFTCIEFDTVCTSCLTNFILNGSKCLSNIRVKFNIQINYIYERAISQSLHQTIIQNIASAISKNEQDIIIFKAERGSIVYTGIVSVRNNETTATIKTSLQTAITNLSLPLRSFSTQYQIVNDSSFKPVNEGLIVGLLIGLSAIVIILFGLHFYYRRQKLVLAYNDEHQQKQLYSLQKIKSQNELNQQSKSQI